MHEPTGGFWAWSGRATTLSAIATVFLVVSPLAPGEYTTGSKAQWAMVVLAVAVRRSRWHPT